MIALAHDEAIPMNEDVFSVYRARHWVAISLGTHRPTQPPTRPNQIMR